MDRFLCVFLAEDSRRLFGSQIQGRQLLNSQVEQLEWITDETTLYESIRNDAADAFDVQCATGREELQTTGCLGRTMNILAAPSHKLRISPNWFTTHRARCRHSKLSFLPCARFLPNFDDRWNHFAGFLDYHGVADANVFALNLIFVMERGSADRTSANKNRIEHGDRRERTCATNLNDDVEQPRLDAFGFILERDRPARRLRGEPENLALRECVDFDDRAVRLIREPGEPGQAKRRRRRRDPGS